MKPMYLKTLKGLLAIGATATWGYMLYEVFHMQGSFIEQAPYCMGGTMLIFGVLTLAYKGLDRLERRDGTA